MPATGQNIVLWAGDDLILRFTIKDAAGAPVDLTGASAKWRLTKNALTRTGSNILLEKSSANSQQIWFDHPSTFWRVFVKLLPVDTENVAPNPNYYHECQVVLSDGTVSTVVVGKFKLNPTVIPDP